MKKFYSILFAMLLPLPVMSQSISIDETNFPDAKFRQFVLDRIDKDDDNLLSQEEIDATAALEIQYKGISDLKGIEFFTELETLYCDGNNLSQFDLSKNTKLKDLDFDSNDFTSVNLSQYASIEKVSCKSNNMQEIGISGLAALKDLDCSSNKLTALDVSGIERNENEEIKSLYPLLAGPSAIMFCNTPNAPAKLIKEISQDLGKPELKGAYVQECAYIGAETLPVLIDIKSREELIGDIVALLQSPARNVISALQSAGGKLAGIVKTLSERE